jgi:hypothetical protein
MLNVPNKRVVMRSAVFDPLSSPTVNSPFIKLCATELLGSIGQWPAAVGKGLAR